MPVASYEDYARLAAAARQLALEAGRTIMVFYRDGTPVETKADCTPVTEADRAADRIIVAGLLAADPGIPVISEESTSTGPAPAGGRFWLVDPLDGTREFIARTGEFTVNIALIEAGRPVVGVLHAPVQGETYVADGMGGAVRIVGDGPPQAIRARPVPAQGPAVVASRLHRDAETNAYIAGLGAARTVSAGSALKFGLLARGEADIYPRFGRTMEWDTAAGQAVLEAAGGHVRDLNGRTLSYGKAGFINPPFVASGAS
ncbi:MAG: 3'(2'),5'-bisphosphate nucleotidase CysQ [Rhodospirillales bacterium]|nr:3'(2'),5'-bisphosphate nucleotidase CysQ [Rhodospirillales bacterium]